MGCGGDLEGREVSSVCFSGGDGAGLASTNLKAILYSYDESKGEWVEIQWIPTHGAKAMALIHHRYGIDLVICNAFDSVKRSATTKSNIFRFLPLEEKVRSMLCAGGGLRGYVATIHVVGVQLFLLNA